MSLLTVFLSASTLFLWPDNQELQLQSKEVSVHPHLTEGTSHTYTKKYSPVQEVLKWRKWSNPQKHDMTACFNPCYASVVQILAESENS